MNFDHPLCCRTKRVECLGWKGGDVIRLSLKTRKRGDDKVSLDDMSDGSGSKDVNEHWGESEDNNEAGGTLVPFILYSHRTSDERHLPSDIMPQKCRRSCHISHTVNSLVPLHPSTAVRSSLQSEQRTHLGHFPLQGYVLTTLEDGGSLSLSTGYVDLQRSP